MLGSESRDEKSRFLPIIFNIRKAKITDAYHKILGLTRIGDNMAREKGKVAFTRAVAPSQLMC
jgi:hypothetical protein